MAYTTLYDLLTDRVPEVRAAAVYALGTLVMNRSQSDDQATSVDNNITKTLVRQVRPIG